MQLTSLMQTFVFCAAFFERPVLRRVERLERPQHGLEALDRDILLIFEPEELTVLSFLSPSPSPTTTTCRVWVAFALAALLRCARRLGHPLSCCAAARGRGACPSRRMPQQTRARWTCSRCSLCRPHGPHLA